jgi:hypothetical protein
LGQKHSLDGILLFQGDVKLIDKVDEMTKGELGPDGLPGHDYFLDAVNHIDEAVANNTIASGAAKGIVFSLVETLGAMVGDPDLPAHLKSGYMGALDLAVELEAKLTK